MLSRSYIRKMNPLRAALMPVCMLALIAAAAVPARADSIDGTWCHDQEARMMTIQGSQLIIDRSVSTGQYSRHSFVADWPAQSPNDPDVGSRVQMRLRGEMNLTWVKVRPNGETTAPEHWHRCQPVT